MLPKILNSTMCKACKDTHISITRHLDNISLSVVEQFMGNCNIKMQYFPYTIYKNYIIHKYILKT